MIHLDWWRGQLHIEMLIADASMLKHIAVILYTGYTLALAGVVGMLGGTLCADSLGAAMRVSDAPSYDAYIRHATLQNEDYTDAVVAKFCKTAVGMKKHQLETWVGQPWYRGGMVPPWKNSVPGRDIWIFRSTFADVVRLTFAGDVCVDARTLQGDDYQSFCDWRANLINKNAIGLTVAQAISKFGEPDGDAAYKRLEAREPRSPNWANGEFDPELPHVQDTLIYFVSTSELLVLEFKNGRCVDIGHLALFSCS